MSTIILLARHARHAEIGRVLSGRSELALDVAGEAQAEQLGTLLAGLPLTAIWSSPRRRCRQTAVAVAAHHQLPVVARDELDEIDFGRWAAQPFAQLNHDVDWQRWNVTRGSAATPAGETMTKVIDRAMTAIRSSAISGIELFVTHCDVIRGVVARVVGLDLNRILSFDIDCASLTTLHADNGYLRLIALNERRW